MQKLIRLSFKHFVIIDDQADVYNGDYFLTSKLRVEKETWNLGIKPLVTHATNPQEEHIGKIKKIELSDVLELIGEVDVEKLALEAYPVTKFEDEFDYRFRLGFNEGFKKAQSLNKKLYTEEDMRKCYEGVLQNVGTIIKQSDLPTFSEYVNSLSQTKSYSVEVEEKDGIFTVTKTIKT